MPRGGGTPHIECAGAIGTQYYYDRSCISTDGTFYLARYNSTSIVILQACKARIRTYNSSVTERDVDAGETIGNGNMVMLIDTSTT